jgi:hypothetical protein
MHEKVKDDDVDVRSCFASISYDKYYNKTTTTMIRYTAAAAAAAAMSSDGNHNIFADIQLLRVLLLLPKQRCGHPHYYHP